MTLRDHAFKSEFVERIFQMFHVHHLFKFCIKSAGVSRTDFFDAETFACCGLRGAGLTNFRNISVGAQDNLHFFFAEFMANQREHIVSFRSEHVLHNLRVIKQVAVEQQEFLARNRLACKPKRINIIRRIVKSVMNESDANGITIMILHEVFNHVIQVTRYNHEFLNASALQSVHRAFQKRATLHVQKALGRVICQRAQTLRHSCSKNYSNHTAAQRLMVSTTT